MERAARCESSPHNPRVAFARPPITELAIAVQFRMLAGIRGINLGPLRNLWHEAYPRLEEHPALVPAIETAGSAQMSFQLNLGQGFTSRYWFLAEAGDELVQVQSDRFVVNWRKTRADAVYPRYESVRGVFTSRFGEFATFVRDADIGFLDITQAEVNYINRIEVTGESTHFGAFLSWWNDDSGHHLGAPAQGTFALTFTIPGLGRPPSRLHVSVSPGDAGGAERAYLMTLIARGAPEASSFESAMQFIDGAHEHANRSFLELTTSTMHDRWGIER